MKSRTEPLVSISYARDHVVYVSDAVDPASHTTIVRIVPKGDVGDLPTSSTSVATVFADATDGSLSILTQPLKKDST
jgi:hypothetical protein